MYKLAHFFLGVTAKITILLDSTIFGTVTTRSPRRHRAKMESALYLTIE